MLDGGKNGGDIEGDELSLSINSLASDFADFEIYLDYANVEMVFKMTPLGMLGLITSGGLTT